MKTAAAVALETPSAEPEKKKQPRRKRSHVERFRTDDDEHADIAALVQDSGLSFGALMRQSLLGDPGPRSKRAAPTPESRLTASHVMAVHRVGVNVNQGIAALNKIALSAPTATSRDRLADEVITVREMLRGMQRSLDEALAAGMAALGR
jgi:hypothetical protein